MPVNPPPFYVSFTDKKSFKSALTKDVIDKYWAEIESLTYKNLPPAVSQRVIATLFGYNPKFIGAFIKNENRYYRSFSIKSGKKKRKINAPKVALKVIQKWFSYHISNAVKYQIDNSVYGFIEGRSAPLAAKQHCNSTWVYNIDIANYFPSISVKKVNEVLLNVGYSEHASSIIASLCCFKEALAQGSPASPVISNLAFKNQDQLLKKLAKEYSIRYTRYADDIVFSGTASPPDNLQSEVRKIIKDGGWSIAENKEHLAKLPHRLKVHGLLVHGEKPRLTKGYRNKIRAYRHLLNKGKVIEEDENRIKGHLYYAFSVENI